MGLTSRIGKLRGELLRLLDQFAYVSAALGRSVPFAGGPRQATLSHEPHLGGQSRQDRACARVTELLPEGEGNSSDPPLPTDVLSRSRDGVALERAFNRI